MATSPHSVSERFANLREVTLELTRTFELEPFLQKVVAAACQGTGSESSSISLYEGETGLLKFVAAPEAQAEQLKLIRVPLENSVAGECYATAEAIVIQDAAQDPRIYRAVDNDLDFITRSLVAVPILLDKEPIGVLEALNKSGDPYNDADLELLEALASLAAITILNTRLMEDVRRYYQEVTELEKMKADFIAVSSHELRTPLGIIIGHASELKESCAQDSQVEELEVILKNAQKMHETLDDLTSVAADSAGHPGTGSKVIYLDRTVESVVANFEEMAKRNNIRLFTRLPDGPLKIFADEEKLTIALGNLVKNAIIYNIDNGKVWVVGERLPGYVKLSVLDTGIGIPEKDLARVFDKFYQVEGHLTRKHGGMGLGLSVAKSMVEAHGGQIWAESVESRGSNFSILLPTGMPQKPGETAWIIPDRLTP